MALENFRWTASAIVVASAAFTYFTSRLTIPIPQVEEKDPAHPAHLALMRQWKALKKAEREREELYQKQVLRTGFPFLKLPREICVAILEHCANRDATYLALIHVSRQMRDFTYIACIPRMPVVLAKTHHVTSFTHLILGRPQLEQLVRNLWLAPEKGDVRVCAIILQRCTAITDLACGAHVLHEALASFPALVHTKCRKFTFLAPSEARWTRLLDHPDRVPLEFFQQLTHLRIYGNVIPAGLPLPCLTHLAYHDNNYKPNVDIADSCLTDKFLYPLLRTAVLTKRRGQTGGLRISRNTDTRVFTFEIPERWTEMDMWRDSVRGKGFWDLCAD